MTEQQSAMVLCRSEGQRLTLNALATRAGLHPALVECFLEYGLIEPAARSGELLLFDPIEIKRLKVIERLRSDLGINLAGVAVVMDMIDRMRALQTELEWLRVRL